MLRQHMQKPLTSVPDPYGEFESFGHHNNAMLRRFLDTFGFEYEFISATEFYKSGRFDDTLRLAAVSMAKNEPIDGERGVCVLTASVAGYEGQIGQIPYASSKAGVIGMTIVAARDLASKFIRVCTIAPGLFDTPILAKLPENVRQSLGASVPHPARLGHPSEYAMTALHILENPMLNGETIRLDGAIRMAPR